MRTGVGAALLVMLSGGMMAAQEQPNFSGTWTATTDPAVAPPAKPAPPVFGPTFTIDHQGRNLTIVRTFAGTSGPAAISLTLDSPTPTPSRMPGRLCEPDQGTLWTAASDGNAIALTAVGAVLPNQKVVKTDVKSALRLESPDTLRVEVTSRSAGQAAPRIVSTLYKRTGPPVTSAASAVKAKATMADVAWISGVWIGGTGTTVLEERWTPAAAGSMMGVSRTLRDGVMAAFEFLCIVERDGGLVYSAMPNGRTPATDFTLTKIDATSALFENPTHDYPKMIRYTRRPDGSLEAVISAENGQKAQTYLFKREQ